jgi:hypothetical protein
MAPADDDPNKVLLGRLRQDLWEEHGKPRHYRAVEHEIRRKLATGEWAYRAGCAWKPGYRSRAVFGAERPLSVLRDTADYSVSCQLLAGSGFYVVGGKLWRIQKEASKAR